MYKMRDEWTDERMDDFRDEVYRRFDDVDKRFDKVEGEVRDLRTEMKAGFEGLYRALFIVGGGIIAALIGVIATQI